MISPNYTRMIASLLVNGYTPSLYYYSYSGSLSLPDSITVVVSSNGYVVATANANVVSITQSGNAVSVTFQATFNTSFTGDTVYLFASSSNLLLYLIAYDSVNVSSSPDDPLVIEWTIEIVVSSSFIVNAVSGQKSIGGTPCCVVNGTAVFIPYVATAIVLYTLVPSAQKTVQILAPNTEIAQVMASLPNVTSIDQLGGITAFVVSCNGTPVYCGGATNGSGIVPMITSPTQCGYTSSSCSNAYVIAMYSIAGVYASLMQAQFNPSVGNAYSFTVVITVT